MEEEMDSLKKNGTLTLTNLPPGTTAIKSRWMNETVTLFLLILFTHMVKYALPKNIQHANDAEIPYREGVGSLIFSVTCPRPGIAYAVNQVVQFSNEPFKAHREAI